MSRLGLGFTFSHGAMPRFSLDVYADRHFDLPDDEQVARAYGHIRRFVDELNAIDPHVTAIVQLQHRPMRSSRAGIVRGVTQVQLLYLADTGAVIAHGPIHRRQQFRLRERLDELASQLLGVPS